MKMMQSDNIGGGDEMATFEVVASIDDGELTGVEKKLLSKLKLIAEDKNDVMFVMLAAWRDDLFDDLLSFLEENEIEDMDDVLDFVIRNGRGSDDEGTE